MTDPTAAEPGGGELAAALREARERSGLSRGDLAQRASVHPSFLSRLERGQYRHAITPDTLAKLSEVLACGDRLFDAAGRVRPAVHGLLAPLGRAYSLAGDAQVRAGLRRLELAGLAAEITDQPISPDDMRIDTALLCKAVEQRCRRPVAVRPVSADADLANRRFWRAHAAAHTLLDTECEWPHVTAPEIETNTLAVLLIAPTRLVSSAVRSASRQAGHTLWDPGCTGLVQFVAERLDLPGWVALRRISEADLDYYLPSDAEEKVAGPPRIRQTAAEPA